MDVSDTSDTFPYCTLVAQKNGIREGLHFLKKRPSEIKNPRGFRGSVSTMVFSRPHYPQNGLSETWSASRNPEKLACCGSRQPPFFSESAGEGGNNRKKCPKWSKFPVVREAASHTQVGKTLVRRAAPTATQARRRWRVRLWEPWGALSGGCSGGFWVSRGPKDPEAVLSLGCPEKAT